MKVALMFAGQGSQYPLMGIEFFTDIKNQEKIKLANKIFGYDVIEALQNNNNELSSTRYTQNLIGLLEMLIFDLLEINYEGLIGFSLGEIVSFYASKIYSFEDTLKLINYRSLIMEEAVKNYPGKMAAILNFDENKIKEVCKNISEKDLVKVANYHSKKQLVISGSNKGVDTAIEHLTELGAKRIVPLNVEGGFHTELMKEAGSLLKVFASTLQKNKMETPIYLNSSTNILKVDLLELELEDQIKSPVYFYQSIDKMIKDGFDTFVEIGPGKVLSGLVSRYYKDVKVFNVEDYLTLKNLEGELK